MKKTVLIIICLGLLAVSYFFFRQNKPLNVNIPSVSLEENVCQKVASQFGDCQRILLFDADSKLVFAESSLGIVPVLTNEEFTETKKVIYPIMDFQEFREEKVERGPIDWRAAQKVHKDFSLIYGFAEDDAKTIIINSEGDIIPNKFPVQENLWVWYVIISKDNVKLPVEVSVYDKNGLTINGK